MMLRDNAHYVLKCLQGNVPLCCMHAAAADSGVNNG